MNAKHYLRRAGGLLIGGAATGAAAYASYAAITYYRYGRNKNQANGEESDSLLDLFMPEYEVADRHHIQIASPAEAMFTAMSEMKISQPGIARALFKARELGLNCATAMAKRKFATCSGTDRQEQTIENTDFISAMRAIGWGVLTEIPGREIVLGAVTQPWVAKPVFRAVRPEEFAAFQEPGYVKIVFTLRADPVNAVESIARTETRVATTDSVAREKFRRYWALVSPGVILIRYSLLRTVKAEAERRARELKPEYETVEYAWYAG